MNNLRKAVAASLTALMLTTASAPAFALQATGGNSSQASARAAVAASDLTGHWAASSIAKWKDRGVIGGYEDGSFKPDRSITRAEFVSVLNKLFGYSASGSGNFSDVPAGVWYEKELAAAKAAGYYEGFPGNQAKPAEAITRQDAATLLARIFEMENPAGAASVSYKDASQISAYAQAAVGSLKNVTTGYEDGTFRPLGKITRAETLALLDRLAGSYYAKSGEYSDGTLAGNAVVSKPDVTLKNMTINGNLYLAAGIGDGNTKLEGVTVKGTVFVSGGGEHTVTLDHSTLNKVQVDRKEGSVRVLATGSTRIETLTADSASKLELEAGASIGSVVLNQPVAVTLAAGAKITTLTVAAAAGQSVISGSGDIGSLVVQAASVTVNGKTVSTGTAAVTGGQAASPSPSASPAPTVAPSAGGSGSTPTPGASVTVDLADKDATSQTRSLFAYLQDIRGKHILFGHQHATDEALSKPVNGMTSDTYAAVGDNPALFGWDTLSLEGFEKPGSREYTPQQNRDNLIQSMKAAYASGGVLTLSSHMPNFVTGGDFYDTNGNVVSHILPGGDKHDQYNAFLDQIADFANHLKDDSGNAIPVIFRPFHEQNGNWFWWGAAFTTKEQYKEIYRYTVEYLRDTKGVHNFLYAFSPGSPFNGLDETFLKTYPGDDYVDILGFDSYYNGSSAGWYDSIVDDAKLISKIADSKGKVAAFTEFGYSGMKRTGNADKEFYTTLIEKLQADPDAKRMAFMLTWANFGYNSIYVPYRDSALYPGENQELLPDFTAFYKDDYTYFTRDLSGVYQRQVTTEEEQPFMHIASPIDRQTIESPTTVIRARVLNEQPTKVVFLLKGSETEHPMTLDARGFYSASWQPGAELNGSETDLTVKVYAADGSVQSQTIKLYFGIPEITMKTYTFDTDISGVKSDGTWQGSGPMSAEFEHATVNQDGKLGINVTSLVYTENNDDTWQEIKIGLTDLESVPLNKVGRVSFEALIPLAAGHKDPEASIRAIAVLPPSDNKFYSADQPKLKDLPKVTVGSDTYALYQASVDLNDLDLSKSATGLMVALVGSGLDYTGPLYVDNLKLSNVYAKTSGDPARVDDFEGYKNSNDLLQSAYSAKGDTNSITLDSSHKIEGSNGLKLGYTLAGEGYTGIVKSLGSVDWSSTGRLKLWLTPDGSGNKLVVQVKANGATFEAYPSLQGTTPGWVEIPFKDFVTASWDTGNAGKKLDTINAKKVSEFAIYVNAPAGSSYSKTNPFKSTLYIDDIRVVAGEAGDIPVGVVQDGMAPGTLFDFEKDAGSWKVGENHLQAKAPAVTGDVSSGGSKALAVEFTPAAASDKSYFLAGSEVKMNWNGSKTLTAKVKLSSGTAKASLYIKTGNWVYTAGDAATVDANGFATLTLNLPGVSNLDTVLELGVKVETTAAGESAILYLDDVTLSR
ncbi:glycosyl hydrolase [Paenibacillus glufosinatiresistens]|uniref:glycosyl hydrolase n=1 Tax=Paenibacillus glufosinatiresistens TaxID=3070657 RepID=UPI00286E6B78|nr:glycosyl hydrolase [Paenibacillus sp. YX.27]